MFVAGEYKMQTIKMENSPAWFFERSIQYKWLARLAVKRKRKCRIRSGKKIRKINSFEHQQRLPDKYVRTVLSLGKCNEKNFYYSKWMNGRIDRTADFNSVAKSNTIRNTLNEYILYRYRNFAASNSNQCALFFSDVAIFTRSNCSSNWRTKAILACRREASGRRFGRHTHTHAQVSIQRIVVCNLFQFSMVCEPQDSSPTFQPPSTLLCTECWVWQYVRAIYTTNNTEKAIRRIIFFRIVMAVGPLKSFSQFRSHIKFGRKLCAMNAQTNARTHQTLSHRIVQLLLSLFVWWKTFGSLLENHWVEPSERKCDFFSPKIGMEENIENKKTPSNGLTFQIVHQREQRALTASPAISRLWCVFRKVSRLQLSMWIIWIELDIILNSWSTL